MRQILKVISLILTDIVIVGLTPFLALFIRMEGSINSPFYGVLWAVLPTLILIRIGLFAAWGLYNRLWRYASISEVVAIVNAVSVSSLAFAAYIYFAVVTVPKSVHLLSWFFTIVLIGGSRFFVRIVHHFRKQLQNVQCANVLIIGAGDAGASIAREIDQRYYLSKRLVGFIDDDEHKNKQRLLGARVLGKRQDIVKIAQEYHVDEIIVAIPSIGGNALREVVGECKTARCSVKILPGLYELMGGEVSLQQLREVALEDLLRRDPIELDTERISGYLANKRVLVTGAGGSIGSELCNQIAKMGPELLVLLGRGENSIYEIEIELKDKFPDLRFKPIIADIRDVQRINGVFEQFQPQVVFHAAAHKHVPLMEDQPLEAINNNVFGTRNVAEAADKIGCEIFIMISTDKAVNPSSAMGATKRVAELIVQGFNAKSNTKYAAVRFGNVLGSRGSVIPLFKRQIAKGGPITITHPDMMRYFMTIPEACQLVLQAGALAEGGEVFVLDMGEPVKILDMACDLIELSGLTPYKDIKIEFTGLRPGEKLFEELLTAEEGTTASCHEKIYMANLKQFEDALLQQGLAVLSSVTEPSEVIRVLMDLLPSYRVARKKYAVAHLDSKDMVSGAKSSQTEVAATMKR